MKSKDFVFRKNPVFGRCPSCNLPNTIHRSRARNWKESVIKKLTFYKIYRCNKCGWRGYLSTITLSSASIKNLFIYMLLGSVTALIINQLLKKIF